MICDIAYELHPLREKSFGEKLFSFLNSCRKYIPVLEIRNGFFLNIIFFNNGKLVKYEPKGIIK
jgi:hypothetical protein